MLGRKQTPGLRHLPGIVAGIGQQAHRDASALLHLLEKNSVRSLPQGDGRSSVQDGHGLRG
ncbi:MAG: hypothetical protein ACLGQX_07245 [Acidobacteriota bacterium]